MKDRIALTALVVSVVAGMALYAVNAYADIFWWIWR